MEKLRLDGIAKSFRNGGGREVAVLDEISLHVDEGEFVSLIGPSGSGKSTLLHLIGGVVPPSAGRVLIDGQDVTGQKGHISYMPQQHSLFPWYTVEDNVMMAMIVAGVSKQEARLKAQEWLGNIGLAEYAREYPHVLSGGMQQRVSFLRALLSPQQVMCLDEPFGALDALTRMDMQRWLLKLWERNRRSVLFITHSIEEALFLSDRIYILSQKPTRILREIKVNMPRPRGEETMLDMQLLQLKQEIYGLMRQE